MSNTFDLTEKDYEYLLEAIEDSINNPLPNKIKSQIMNTVGENLMKELAGGGDGKMIMIELKKRKDGWMADRDTMIDDLKILQAKLLMLKRKHIEENALRQTSDALNQNKTS